MRIISPRRNRPIQNPLGQDLDWRDLQSVSLLAQVPVAISALEEIVAIRRGDQARFLPTAILRTRFLRLSRVPLLSRVLSDRADAPIAALQLASSLALLVVPKRSAARMPLEAVQVLCLVRQYIRSGGYGRDGSDHALIVQHSMLLAAHLAPDNADITRRALTFIGAQGTFSYFVSGIVKLISPVWRHGIALSDTLRTINYGHDGLFRFLRRHPALRRLGAWSVIASETLFPVVVVLPGPLSTAYSVSMIGMHTGIAGFMGLNRFLWAFAAFHPAIHSLRRRKTIAVLTGTRRHK